MHRIFRVKAYEKEHGPHFNEEYARKAVMKMENEDGTRGPHWSLEETTTLASQYGIALGSKFNRYEGITSILQKLSEHSKKQRNTMQVLLYQYRMHTMNHYSLVSSSYLINLGRS